MTKEPLPIIPNRHYAQSSLSIRRNAQRAERIARGEADAPKRRWKKGRGTHAITRRSLAGGDR